MTTKGKLEEAGNWAQEGIQNRDKKVRRKPKEYPLFITKWSVLGFLQLTNVSFFVFYKNLNSSSSKPYAADGEEEKFLQK